MKRFAVPLGAAFLVLGLVAAGASSARMAGAADDTRSSTPGDAPRPRTGDVAPPAAGPAALRPFADGGPHAVGVRTVVLVDPSRIDPLTGGARTLVTEIWYPATEEARTGTPTRFVDFFGDHPEAAAAYVAHFGGTLEDVNRRFVTRAVRDAPRKPGRFPLLVFSHGNGGLRHQNCFQMDHLASHGYVVASPDHTGNAGVSVLPSGPVPYDRTGRSQSSADRPADVRFIIDALSEATRQQGHWLDGALNCEAIGVLGHSFGGLTSCQVAESDRRVKAILPMTVAFWRPSPVPAFVMLAERDRTMGEAGNIVSRAYYASCPGPKYLLVLRRGGHFSFSDMDCINPSFGDGIGSETRDGQRAEFISTPLAKAIINAYSLAFFEHYLRGDPGAKSFLEKSAWPEEVELRSDVAGSTRAGAGTTPVSLPERPCDPPVSSP